MTVAAKKLPAVTVLLGTVIDAELEHGDKRIELDEWRGYQILVDPDAFDRSPPHCRLYFVRGKLDPLRDDPSETLVERALDAYHRWHRRDSKAAKAIDWKPASYPQGRLVTLGYRSDKWGPKGRRHDYTHSFLEDGGKPPLVYTNARTLAAATTIVVVGGSMRITERGIA